MTTESDCLVLGLCTGRPGLVSSSKSTSSRKSATDSADHSSEKDGVETTSHSDEPARKIYFPDPSIGLESSTFSSKQENAAAKLERDLIRSDETWYWTQMNLAMGAKYGVRFPSEIHRVSPATRMALLRNMQNYPRSQIVEEGYDPDWPGGDTMFGAIADGDERALSYVARPEKLCSKRQSNAQIWFANAPPVEAIPPPGREGWDEGIFEREKAICPVPEKDLYSGAGDPLEPVAEASRSESESKRKEGNVEEATEAFLQEEKNEEPVESRDSGPLVGEGLALPRGIVGSLKRKKKADSV